MAQSFKCALKSSPTRVDKCTFERKLFSFTVSRASDIASLLCNNRDDSQVLSALFIRLHTFIYVYVCVFSLFISHMIVQCKSPLVSYSLNLAMYIFPVYIWLVSSSSALGSRVIYFSFSSIYPITILSVLCHISITVNIVFFNYLFLLNLSAICSVNEKCNPDVCSYISPRISQYLHDTDNITVTWTQRNLMRY